MGAEQLDERRFAKLERAAHQRQTLRRGLLTLDRQRRTETGRFELCLGFAYRGLDFGKEPTIAGFGLDQGRVGTGQQGHIAHFDGQRDADCSTSEAPIVNH